MPTSSPRSEKRVRADLRMRSRLSRASARSRGSFSSNVLTSHNRTDASVTVKSIREDDEETTMKAIAIDEFGDPSGMRVVDAPVPVTSATQVLVRTEAIGVGGVD